MKIKTVLIADDNNGTRRVLARLLARRDRKTIQAVDGENALAMARDCGPDLILLDIRMPGINGYEVCQRLKSGAGTRDIPILMLSGLGHELSAQAGLCSGADGYMSKPFDFNELSDRIDALIRPTLRRKA